MFEDDEKPLTFGRALRTPEFWLLLVAATCSMSGVLWWVVVLLKVAPSRACRSTCSACRGPISSG